MDLVVLKQRLAEQARERGFQQMGVADIDLSQAEQRLLEWLDAGRQGTMEWMAAHGRKRSRPAELEPGVLRVLSFRMNYLPEDTQPLQVLRDKRKAYITRYALGRDYHKMMRKRLAGLAAWLREQVADSGLARAFVDSAPVMEKPLAAKAGLGWQGKHTLILNREAGSWFFLGEIYTDLPFPVDEPATNHCGKCSACITVCPTKAIVAPYQLDARRCISYLTIEHDGPIPEELRPGIGNRVFGCDDCQLMCPWNRFASHTDESDFRPRHGLDDGELTTLFLWDEATFLERTAGSAIRRAGYRRWLRNLAVALGNAPADPAIVAALKHRADDADQLIREHVAWALAEQARKAQRIL